MQVRNGHVQVENCEGLDVAWRSFYFEAEDGIRGAQESRGLGDVYKRQVSYRLPSMTCFML